MDTSYFFTTQAGFSAVPETSNIYSSATARNQALLCYLKKECNLRRVCHRDSVDTHKLHLIICCKPSEEHLCPMHRPFNFVKSPDIFCDECYDKVKDIDCLRIKYHFETGEAEFAPELTKPHKPYSGSLAGPQGLDNKYFHLFSTSLASAQ